MKPTYYCLCHGTKLAKLELPNQRNLMLNPVEYVTPGGYLRDNIGDNISDLNIYFGQTTGLYWVYKNAQEDILGISTYRLFWDSNSISEIADENTIIVPKEIDVNTALENPSSGKDHTIKSHYMHCHGELYLTLLYGLCHVYDLPITTKMIDELDNQTMLIPFNMFIAKKEYFQKICEILFDILFKYFRHYSGILHVMQKNYNQKRSLDFLAERILHIIFTNLNTFIPDAKLAKVDIINLPH